MSEKKQIWVFAEDMNGKPAAVYRELLGKARELADKMGDTSIASVVIGADTSSLVEQIKPWGTEIIYVAEHCKLSI